MNGSRWKHWMHVLAGIACAAGSIACALAAWDSSAMHNRFMAYEEIKDLGVLKQQEEADVSFHLINASGTPVEIIRVETSCTCTRAEPTSHNIQPGDSAELKVHLRVGNLRGQVAALVSVLYRLGDKQSLQRLPLTITTMVKPHYVVTPDEVVFEVNNGVGEDLRREANILIAPNEGTEIQVLKAYSTHPAVRVASIKPDAAAGSTTLHLIFDRTLCIDPTMRAGVVVHTDSKMEPIYRVPVRVVSKGVH